MSLQKRSSRRPTTLTDLAISGPVNTNPIDDPIAETIDAAVKQNSVKEIVQ